MPHLVVVSAPASKATAWVCHSSWKMMASTVNDEKNTPKTMGTLIVQLWNPRIGWISLTNFGISSRIIKCTKCFCFLLETGYGSNQLARSHGSRFQTSCPQIEVWIGIQCHLYTENDDEYWQTMGESFTVIVLFSIVCRNMIVRNRILGYPHLRDKPGSIGYIR